MEKRIDLENGDIVRLDREGLQFSINKGYVENGEPTKLLTMRISHDFYFEGYPFLGHEEDIMHFNIPTEDPLYKHFNNLLGTDTELVIEDDDTVEEKAKYLKIERGDADINVSFYNYLENESINSKFIIFVKNIQYDLRSKIDNKGLDTKDRLVSFFRDVEREELIKKIKDDDRDDI